MLLRVSGKASGDDYDLQAATSGDAAASGVAHGAELAAFVDAALRDDDGALTDARATLLDVLGAAAVVDAAAVIATFSMQVRVADSTGIPLDEPLQLATSKLRDELGVSEFGSASNTPTARGVKRLLSRVLEPAAPFVMRLSTAIMKRR